MALFFDESTPRGGEVQLFFWWESRVDSPPALRTHLFHSSSLPRVFNVLSNLIMLCRHWHQFWPFKFPFRVNCNRVTCKFRLLLFHQFFYCALRSETDFAWLINNPTLGSLGLLCRSIITGLERFLCFSYETVPVESLIFQQLFNHPRFNKVVQILVWYRESVLLLRNERTFLNLGWLLLKETQTAYMDPAWDFSFSHTAI